MRPSLKWVRSLADTQCVEEETVELIVEVTKPDQKSKWLRNGRVINPNEERFAGRFTILTSGRTHTLTIKNLTLKDAAEFAVQVDELTSKGNLIVNECKRISENKPDLTQV